KPQQVSSKLLARRRTRDTAKPSGVLIGKTLRLNRIGGDTAATGGDPLGVELFHPLLPLPLALGVKHLPPPFAACVGVFPPPLFDLLLILGVIESIKHVL